MLGEDRSPRSTMVATVAEKAPPPSAPAEPTAPAIPEILEELRTAPPAVEMLAYEPEPEVPVPADAPRQTQEFDVASVETVQEFEDALNSLDSPLPETERIAAEPEIADVSFAQAQEPEAVSVEDVKHVRVRSNIDILAELDKLRKDATATPVTDRPAKKAAPGISIDDLLASSLNHRREINRIFELQVPRQELAGGHQVTIGLRIEDSERNPVGEEKTFAIELHTRPDLEKLLLSLKFHIFAK
jgi:hypothetical protein